MVLKHFFNIFDFITINIIMIRESELILNRDGSIFHLHLLPGQVADTVILVGDPGRVKMIAGYFNAIELKV